MRRRKKQISVAVTLPEWLAIRQEAARLKITMTELCLRMMKDGIAALPEPRNVRV